MDLETAEHSCFGMVPEYYIAAQRNRLESINDVAMYPFILFSPAKHKKRTLRCIKD
jgi:hypothetical protein